MKNPPVNDEIVMWGFKKEKEKLARESARLQESF